MTDHDLMENLLRSSLAERAQDVEVTPALYAEVQRRATRGAWLRRGLVLAGATAVVVGAVTLGPSLLPEQELPPIMEQPDGETPTEVPPSEPPSLTTALLDAGVAHALDDGSGGSVVHVGNRTVASARQVVSLTTASTGASTIVVAGRADGSIGVIDVGGALGDGFDQIVDADANGGRAVPTPDTDGVAWLEGSDLHVLPLADDAEVRILPLDGPVPDDLRVEQWFSQADAQVILASAPGGGVWSIPMDDSNVFNTAPTAPAFLLDESAVDSALQPTLQRVSLRSPLEADGPLVLAEDDDLRALPTELAVTSSLTLTNNGVGAVTLVDRETGTGLLLELVDGALGSPVTQWQDPRITAAVQVVTLDDVAADDATQDAPDTSAAADLGLRTDAPVIGTDGVELVLRTADGGVERREVFPVAESEAVLGDLAVRPGSTSTDGLVAVESTSEGETSVRFVALDGSTAVPVGDMLRAVGEITGLVWSDDGREIAWTDDLGLRAARVVDDGSVPGGEATLLSDDTRPVIDWVWSEGVGADATSGWLTVATSDGSQFLGVARATDGTLTLSAPVGQSDRLSLDTHASPGAAVGPSVGAMLTGDGVELGWGADGDQFGALASPGPVGADVRVDASGGQVLVLGAERQVLVTFDGEVVDLPFLTDWDVLD